MMFKFLKKILSDCFENCGESYSQTNTRHQVHAQKLTHFSKSQLDSFPKAYFHIVPIKYTKPQTRTHKKETTFSLMNVDTKI